MLKIFNTCSHILNLLTQKYEMYFMPILVILKHQVSIVFISVMAWCNCMKVVNYFPHRLYANRPAVIIKADFLA